MAKVKEHVILPGSYQLRPQPKNFLAENVKKLRNLQKQVQKKTVQAQNSLPENRKSRVPKDTRSDSDASPSIKSRVSTPITALESAKPIKNQKIQTVTGTALKSGKIIKASTLPREKKAVRCDPLVHVTDFQDSSGGGDDISGIDESRGEDDLELLRRIVSKENKDFVETNTYKLYNEKPRRSKANQPGLPPTYKKGEVPKYLRSMKRELVKYEENETLDPDCPPGFVKLSDEDRQAHLTKLLSTHNELIRKHNSLPLRVTSMSMKQRKTDLDRELGKIEEAVKLFSRDKLYVKIGD